MRHKGDLDHAECVHVSDFAVIHCKSQRIVTPAAGADYDFANSMAGINLSIRILGCESFVGMFVADEQQIGVGLVQISDYLFEFGMYGVLAEDSTAEECVMAEGDNAGAGMLTQILSQPGFFG